ncbi:ZAN protein, partial [Polyodon spathula]|nr:ZAN protein [Polyodon spathula]
MSCPASSDFRSCGTGCPATCTDFTAPSKCSLPPAEGCFCKDGYVLSGDRCVFQSECGCRDENNDYHQLGESWFTNDNCIERCQCNGTNTIRCAEWQCGVQERCKVQDGVLGCHTTGSASCHVAGDPHYFTFDKVMHTFMGTCAYTLVHVCDAHNVTPVTITGLNEYRGQLGATYLREVYIDVYNTRVTVQKGKALLVCQIQIFIYKDHLLLLLFLISVLQSVLVSDVGLC